MSIGTPYTLGADATSTSTSTTISLTTSTPSVAGDRIFVETAYRASTPATLSCTDGTHTWNLDKQQDGGNGSAGIFSLELAGSLASGTTITVTGGSAVRRWMRVTAVSGTASGAPDANHVGGNNGSGSAPTVSTVGSVGDGSYVIGTLSRYGAGASDSATSGGTGTFVEQADAVLGSGTPRMQYYSETQILSGVSGTITASPSWSSTTGGWEAVIAAYEAASAPPATTNHFLSTLGVGG